MCGVAGFYRPGSTPDPAIAIRMAGMLTHRGPDDEGVWSNAEAGISLAHRRLAILDLTPAGHQPMKSPCSRYVVSFNGEIYNHLILRAELETNGTAFAWRGSSDTETLLAAICHWGVVATLNRLVGMFSLALWDQRTRSLTLARDRMGEKPLYYGWQNGTFLFGSELKALRSHPAFVGEIDRAVLPLYFRHGYVPAPHSIYKGIRKLEPGCFLTIGENSSSREPERQVYWSLRDVALSGMSEPFDGSEKEAVDSLEELLRTAIAGQMIADVPVGAFLSGGVDSSTVVALMQAQSSRPVKTFSIGFDEHGYDEAVYAKAVARHLGTEHAELYISPREAMGVIPGLPHIYDEPLSDSSQIPTFLLAKMARQSVLVALSGDGGDELFGGYTRYGRAVRMHRRLGRFPRWTREAFSTLMMCLKVDFSGRWERRRDLLVELLRAESHGDFYRSFVTHWLVSDEVTVGNSEATYGLSRGALDCPIGGVIDVAMIADGIGYLPDDVLVKVDRAAMAVSLECRVPMLDHRIVEWAWRLPSALKYGAGNEKRVLRQLLDRYVPPNLIDRPKKGFGIPIAQWLRGPLQEWASDLISPRYLREEGLLNPIAVHRKWEEHLSGSADWAYHLWDVLMFQAWLRQQKNA